MMRPASTKRVSGPLFDGLTGLSLLIGVAVVVLWVRSYRVHDWTGFHAIGRTFEISTANHALQVEWTDRPYRYILVSWGFDGIDSAQPLPEFIRPQHHAPTSLDGRPEEYRWLGFYLEPTYHQAPGDAKYDCWFSAIGLPYYFLFALTGVAPVIRAKRWLKNRRRTMFNLCHVCGYNLTGNISGICPECGTTVAAPAARTTPLKPTKQSIT